MLISIQTNTFFLNVLASKKVTRPYGLRAALFARVFILLFKTSPLSFFATKPMSLLTTRFDTYRAEGDRSLVIERLKPNRQILCSNPISTWLCLLDVGLRPYLTWTLISYIETGCRNS